MYQTHSPHGSAVGQPYCSLSTEFDDAVQRRAMIAQAAYFRAKRRGFVPGHELEDWLTAESEVDMGLTIAAAQ